VLLRKFHTLSKLQELNTNNPTPYFHSPCPASLYSTHSDVPQTGHIPLLLTPWPHWPSL
jgi:hypothetical protein